MIQYKRVFLLLGVGLGLLVGRVWADDQAASSSSNAQAGNSSGTQMNTAASPAKPESPNVINMKAANALMDAGKYDEAIAAYEKMGELKSNRMEAWRCNNEGLACLDANKNDQALPLLEKATTTDPSNSVAWNNLGVCYERLNQLDKAKDAYQKSIDAAKEANASSDNAQANLQFVNMKLEQAAAKNGVENPAASSDAADSAASDPGNKSQAQGDEMPPAAGSAKQN